MAQLDSVLIRGIRSIGDGDENEQCIHFFHPLTIICGPNGTGKTTIIESLNYVTTGQMPPGKMAAFIHDGQKKTQNRSEETTFAFVDKSGKTRSLSSKVADINKELTTRLGVPSAILEYVVFCHQEDGNWPLGEPKELKVKFDAIFQATRYVKAIDKLKSLIKVYTNDCKVLDGKVPLLNGLREQKMEFSRELRRDMTQVEKLNETFIAICGQLQTMQEQCEQLKKQRDEADKATRAIEKMESEERVLKQQLNAMTYVAEYAGSIEDLRAEIANISASSEFRDLERERGDLNGQIRSLERDMAMKKEEIADVNHAMNQLQAQLLRRDEIVAEKSRLVRELVNEHKLNEHSPIASQLDDARSRLRLELTQRKDEMDAEVAECGQRVEAAMQQTTRFTETRRAKLDQRKALMAEVDRGEKQLATVATSGSRMRELQRQIDGIEEELARVKCDDDDGSTRVDVVALKRARDEIRDRLESLRDERDHSQLANRTIHTLSMKESELNKMSEEKAALVERHRGDLEELALLAAVGDQQGPMKHHLNEMHAANDADLQCAEEACKQAERALATAHNRVANIEEQVQRGKVEAMHRREQLDKTLGSADCTVDSLTSRVHDVDAQLEKMRRKLGLSDGRRGLYEEMRDEARQRNVCPTCERPCRERNEQEELIQKLTEKLANLPTQIADEKRVVTELETESRRLHEMLPLAKADQQWMEESAPRLHAELKEWKEKVTDLTREFEKQKARRDAIALRQAAVSRVMTDASLIDNYWQSLRSAQTEIARLRAELASTGCSSQRTLQDIEDEMSRMENEHRAIEKRIDEAQVIIDRRNALTEQVHHLRGERMTLGECAMQAETCKTQLNEKRMQLRGIDDELNAIEEKIPEMEMQYKLLRGERETIESAHRDRWRQLNDAQRQLETGIQRLDEIEKKLVEGVGIQQQMNERRAMMDKLIGDEKTCGERMQAVREQLLRLDAKQDAKRVREEQLHRMEMREQLRQIEMKLVSDRWTGIAPQELRNRIEQVDAEYSALCAKKYETKGHLDRLRESTAENQQRLMEEKYASAEKLYVQAKIDQLVTAYTIEDLKKYIAVLDDAVIAFHAQRMAAVNAVLCDLWRAVYKGNDIECIALRSESVDEGEKRKAYNYRVVMTVDGVEVEMRGRCSAGQKVLASILIRLALADVFCSNCAIIALDEPTTNLDVNKVESLAEMLADLIDARCRTATSRFQMLVITHDQRLVEHLMLSCRPEFIYGLNKKPNGLATIARHRHIEDIASPADS